MNPRSNYFTDREDKTSVEKQAVFVSAACALRAKLMIRNNAFGITTEKICKTCDVNKHILLIYT